MTNQQRVAVEQWTASALKAGVPNHLASGFALYLVCGIRPGGYCLAVLENNLREAYAMGDEASLAGQRKTVTWLWNEVPASCWGSPEKVAAWKGDSDYVNR